MANSIKGYTTRNSELRIMPKLSKIDKLALRTNKWMNKKFTSYWIEDPERLEPVWNKKFAELIAKQCAAICRQQGNEHALKFDRENCAAAIEEYFGVK